MTCQVIVINSSAYFYPGSNIDGKVMCQFKDTKVIRGIKLRLKGKEHTEWRTGSSQQRNVYTENNVFLVTELNLRGEGSIGPGYFEFPFKLNLPNNCPGTYVLDDSFIEYSIKAVVDIPFLFDYESRVILNVIAPIDFNTQNVNMDPVHLEAEKTILCLWCASGPIIMDLYLDKQAYVLGDTIKFKLHCSNLSNKNINSFLITLKKVIVLKAGTYTKERKQLIQAMGIQGIGPYGERDYDSTMTIPHDVYLPNFNMCTLFQLLCKFKVTAKMPTLIKNFGVEALLTLGSVYHNKQSGDISVPYPSPLSYLHDAEQSNCPAGTIPQV